MVKFSILFLCNLAVWLATAPAVLAQQDTAKYELSVVEIFGKPAEVFAVGSRVISLDSAFLQANSSRSLTDALQQRTPIYFKTYGASGISSVSFRGTGASHTAVLWNGLNIAIPSLGQSDFASIPVSGVGAVAVQHGAASANYGNGAIGGAVLLSSPEYNGTGFGAQLKQEASSFGNYFSNAALHYAGKKVSVGGNAYWKLAQNRFKYRDISRFGAPERTQDYAQVQQLGFTQDLVWHLTPKSNLALRSWYTYTDREVQPTLGAANPNAKQLDQNLRLLTEYGNRSRWGETNVKAAYFSDFLRFTDNNTFSETDIRTYQVQAEQTYTYRQRWRLRGGLNLQRFDADVQGYGGEVTEDRAAAFALLRFDPTEPLQLSLNLRQQFIKGYNPVPTPTLGANWRFFSQGDHQLYLKGNISGSYRVPTLNERFWRPGGNPNLKPEQGWNYESGLRHTYTLGNIQLETEATLYQMLVDNWVQWMPSTGFWSPVNLQKVRSQGIELSSRISTKMGEAVAAATVGYTDTSAEQVASYEGPEELDRQLAYVPLHKATLASDASFRTWSLISSLNYTGKRYTNNTNTGSLPAFALLDLALNKSLKLREQTLVATAHVDNITNTRYTTLQNLPMPGRQYTLGLRFLIP